ncbi:MAG: hypothetical protein CMB89_10235, partial [Flammeovirgaceae bacterium]|nr:hypothetical protein [Flammeovirgaceae bacterium]
LSLVDNREYNQLVNGVTINDVLFNRTHNYADQKITSKDQHHILYGLIHHGGYGQPRPLEFWIKVFDMLISKPFCYISHNSRYIVNLEGYKLGRQLTVEDNDLGFSIILLFSGYHIRSMPTNSISALTIYPYIPDLSWSENILQRPFYFAALAEEKRKKDFFAENWMSYIDMKRFNKIEDRISQESLLRALKENLKRG